MLDQFILDASQQENYITTLQNIEPNHPNQKWSPKKERASFSARMFRPWSGSLHVGQLLTYIFTMIITIITLLLNIIMMAPVQLSNNSAKAKQSNNFESTEQRPDTLQDNNLMSIINYDHNHDYDEEISTDTQFPSKSNGFK